MILTRGCISEMMRGNQIGGPVVQILSIKRIPGVSGKEQLRERYRSVLFIS